MYEPGPARDEPAGEEPQRGSNAAPPSPPAPNEPIEERDKRAPEASEIVPDHREAPLPTSPADTSKTVGYTDDRAGGHSTGAASARPEERPGDHARPTPNQPSREPEPERGDDDFVTPTNPVRVVSSDVRRDATLHQDAGVPDRQERPAQESFAREKPAREGLVAPDHRASGAWEDHTPPVESSPPETGARETSPVAPGHMEPDSSSLPSRRPASEAPAATNAWRRGGVPPPESVVPDRTGVKERTPPRTVQVTIGRVEIRAIPPAPAQPLPESKPVLSLEDYLRQHSGARR
jgi:hypothetical protein